jgi:hypothetical protein
MRYTKLAQQHREIAALLMATANEMAGYRELPMADHAKVMSDPKVAKAFEKFVNRNFWSCSRTGWEQDHKMLVQMQSSTGR